MGVAMLLSALLAVLLRDRYADGRGPLACGVVLGIVAAFASAAWDRAWRAELRGEIE
jgi:hypothetical protein